VPPSQRTVLKSAARSILITVVPVSLWLAPLPLEPKPHHALAITAFMILAWITEAMNPGLAGVIGSYLFWALGVVRFDVAFGGFANDTPWFLLGAIVLGVVASKSGLARRLAYITILRVGVTYQRLLLALILADFCLTFVVPAGIARVVILAAVALGLLEALALGPGSNLGRGMFLIITYTAGVFDKTIIAGAAAITGRGIIEIVGHVEVLWSRWFLAYLPSDIITILVAWRLVLWLYPPENASLPGGIHYLTEELRKMGRWNSSEKKALILILAAVALWMTDFVHHIPPSMICIGIALLAALPVFGALDVGDLQQTNYLPIFCFVASAVSMGEVLRSTKSLERLTSVLFSWLEPLLARPHLSSFVLYWTGFVYHIFLGSEVSMLVASLPSLMDVAHAHGLNPLALGMIWTFSSGGKIFVYQSAVMIAGYSYGYFTSRDLLRLGFCMSIVDSLQMLLVIPIYWPLIGIRMGSVGS
jgi:solute carrier family 13 (sodium-dependent dicarboxylate transporter), member 2/3/5